MAVDRYRFIHDSVVSAVGQIDRDRQRRRFAKKKIGLMKFVILLLSLLPGLLVGEQIKPLTVEYAKVAGKSLKLDFYQPDDHSKSRPLIVWVHGGAWRAGNRKSVPIKELLNKGFAIASVDYRLTPVAPYPANVHDIKAAIRFLRAHTAKYRIDDEQISVAGVSAGGHLAALVGLTNGSAEHEGAVGDFLKVSSEVQAVVSFYGASDLLSILGQSTPHGLSVRVPALNLLLGGPPTEKLELARLASPLHQLDSTDPRVLLIHGDQDPQMPYQQSKDLHAACLKLEIPCELVTVKGGKHGGREFYQESLMTKVAGFLSKAKPFVHPGMLHSETEITFIKKKIASGEEPWKSAWDQLQSAEGASLTYTPKPTANVVRGARNRTDIGSSDLSDDAAAAYAHALQWSLTGKQAHADKVIEILNAWSGTLKSVGGHDAKLLIGMDGVSFCNAAELIRHTNHKWAEKDQQQFEKMLREVFYPVIKDFHPTANGNWDASMIQTMIAMGIFLDDRAMFDRATNYFLSGEGNGAITKYFNHFGQCQESGRDQLHTQMGMGFLSCACEMAWKQGVDFYRAADNRLALGYEYTAKYNLGEDVPFEPYRSVEGRYFSKKISRNSRGRFRPIYERIVHHYHDRKALDMPYSRKVADKKRPEKPHGQHISWGTLMSYGLPNDLKAKATK